MQFWGARTQPVYKLFEKKLEHIFFQQLEALKVKLVYCDCRLVARKKKRHVVASDDLVTTQASNS